MSTTEAANESKEERIIIHCPFLRALQPDTSSLWAFATDLETKGKLGRIEGLGIGFQHVLEQKGLWAALGGAAPDIYRLDQAGKFSHADLYQKYLSKFDDKAADGILTLDDLVNIKKEIAVLEQVAPIARSSKIETGLLFLGAAGNLETGQVSLENVKTFLNGGAPVEGQAEVTFGAVKAVMDKCRSTW